MPNRTDLLNFLAEKYNLQRYLELGVQVKALNFDKIKCRLRVGVDPDPAAEATFCKTSDEFFDFWLSISGDQIAIPSTTGMEPMLKDEYDDLMPLLKRPRFSQQVYSKYFDLIFIDGLHTAEQVKKDFENALKVLSPNGFIVLHDCNPLKEEHTIVPRPTERGHWNGDVYKFACELGLYSRKFNVVDIDNGCGVWNWAGMDIQKDSDGWWPETWENFDRNRKELLNLISWDEFINSHS